jgi:hypothetical protein
MFLPTDIALDAEHDTAASDEDLIGHQSTTATDADTENTSAPDINEISRDLAPQTERKAPTPFRHIARGVVKPLVALVTAQYVIATALVAGVAMTVAHHASRALHEKFAAIVSAIERF